MQINQIKAQNDKFIITTPVEGVLSDIREPRTFDGKDGQFTSQSAKLTQGQDWIFIEANGKDDLRQLEGQTVRFESTQSDHGINGVKVRKIQKGDKTYTNLRITASAKMTVVGSAQPPPVQQPAQQQPAPVQQNYQQPPAQTTQGVRQGQVRINGQTVGMSIGRAVEAMASAGMIKEGYLSSRQFAKDLWHLSSAIIRVAGHLEEGHLAPKSEDAKEEAPQPAPQPVPPKVEDGEHPF